MAYEYADLYVHTHAMQIWLYNTHKINISSGHQQLVSSLVHTVTYIRPTFQSDHNIKLRKKRIDDQPSRNNYVRKPKRPTIALDSSDKDRALFIDTWSWYKEMCLLMNLVVIQNELRTACTPELNRLLFDLLRAKKLNSATKEQLLQHIRLIAVRGLHEEVHW